MTVLMYIIVYMLTGVILASVIYTIEKRDLNFWREKIFAFVDEKSYKSYHQYDTLQRDIDEAEAQNTLFMTIAAFIWPLPFLFFLLYGLLMLIRKVTIRCVNGIIDIFIGKESDRKDDDDMKDDSGKKSGRGKNAGSRFNG